MARLSLFSDRVRALVDEQMVPLFLAERSTARVCKILNDRLSGLGADGTIHPNRVHAWLSDDVSRGVNEATLALVEQAAADPQVRQIVKAQRDIMIAERQARAERRGILTKRVAQLQEEIKGLRSMVDGQTKQIAFLQTEIGNVEYLLKDGLETVPRHLALKRSEAELIAERGENLALIARAEAGKKGYDAVQYGARIKPPLPPTAMTVQQIYDWIDDTPGQPHAIGRYQFIPATLRRLMQRLKIDPRSPFSPHVQDRLADQLLVEAGLQRFLAGDLPRHAFMNNLAKIWAGLPNDTGKSHYDGYAGNKATMTWAHFDAEMARIFPG